MLIEVRNTEFTGLKAQYMQALRAGDDARSALSNIVKLRLAGVDVAQAEQQAEALLASLIAVRVEVAKALEGTLTTDTTLADIEAEDVQID